MVQAAIPGGTFTDLSKDSVMLAGLLPHLGAGHPGPLPFPMQREPMFARGLRGILDVPEHDPGVP